MLRMAAVKLEIISDIDMHLFIEKGMRGGISYIVTSHSKAKNKYVRSYDSNKKVSSLLIRMQIIYMSGQ